VDGHIFLLIDNVEVWLVQALINGEVPKPDKQLLNLAKELYLYWILSKVSASPLFVLSSVNDIIYV